MLYIVIDFIAAAVVLYIVSWLNLGIKVDSLKTVFLAAIVTTVGSTIPWLLGLFAFDAGLLSIIVSLIVVAVILLVSGKFLKGLKVNGFGALIAAVAITFIGWLVSSDSLDALGIALGCLVLILGIIGLIHIFIIEVERRRIE